MKSQSYLQAGVHKKVVGGFVKERMGASPPTPYKKGGSAPSLTSPARGPVPLTPFILPTKVYAPFRRVAANDEVPVRLPAR